MRYLVYTCSWQMASTTLNGQKRPPDKCLTAGCIGEFRDRVPKKYADDCFMLETIECRVKEERFQKEMMDSIRDSKGWPVVDLEGRLR